MKKSEKLSLWLRWVGANAMAEMVGLGATFAIDFLIIAQFAGQGIPGSIISILLVTASGAIEGSVVGLLQWLVLRRPFPEVKRRAWIMATIVGAMVAWFFGSLPSTLIDMGAQQSGTGAEEPSAAVVLLLAAGMGLVLGVVLAFPQWRVLRRVVMKAWWWIPANAIAWALGMAIIFAAMDLAFNQATTVGSAGVIAGALLLAGAVVGAVHGLALVRLTGEARVSSY